MAAEDDADQIEKTMAEFQSASLRLADSMADMAAVAARMQKLMLEDAAIMMAAMESFAGAATTGSTETENGSASDERK